MPIFRLGLPVRSIICASCIRSFTGRSLSTGAAIRRGIRKSNGKSSLSRTRFPTTPSTRRGQEPNEARIPRDQNGYEPRFPKKELGRSSAASSQHGRLKGRLSERLPSRSTERMPSLRDSARDRTSFTRKDSVRDRTPSTRNSARERMSSTRRDSTRDKTPFTRDSATDRMPFKRDSARDRPAPLAVPYTTSASEFLYGTSVVEAALASSRRKLYKLYVFRGEEAVATATRGAQDAKARSLARSRGVDVEIVSGPAWMSLMSKMSKGRPHNGYCLEASPLKRPAVASLSDVIERRPGDAQAFRFEARSMALEERDIHGSGKEEIVVHSSYPRYPFVVLLDGVVDVGNLGGILRSAHFLGADAVALSGNCAPLNPVVLKASTGAAEVLPLLSVPDTTGFVEGSKAAGWRVYASAAPPLTEQSGDNVDKTKRGGRRSPVAGSGRCERLAIDELRTPLRLHPCLLMLGGEGDGLRADLERRADAVVGIPSRHRQREEQGRDHPVRKGQNQRGDGQSNVPSSSVIVDSLNVSVAAGILMDAFLRPAASSSSSLSSSVTRASGSTGMGMGKDLF